MPISIFDDIKAATCRIEGGGSTGTGYLVSGNRIVTCHHVIEKVLAGQAVTVTFPGHPSSKADVLPGASRQWDAAVLDWKTPVAGLAPLRFGKPTERKLVWEGYGYPGLASGSGLPIDGTLDDLAGEDTRRVVSLVLTADKLASGTGAPPHGFSGTPVVLNGFVIGHLKRILEDPSFKRHVAFGTVYAARAEDFLNELLPGETLHSAASRPETAAAAAPPDGFDVFLSASAADLPRASQLARALRDKGRRVFFPLSDVVPGNTEKSAIDDGLMRSKAAIIFFTPQWLQDTAIERDALWARRNDSSLPIIPVLSDSMGDDLPAPWDSLRPIDMRRRDFADPAFERLLYAIDGKTAPFEIVAADLARLLKQDEDPRVTAANAKRLISIGNPGRALEILPDGSRDLEIRRLRALALSKRGRTDDAIEILKAVQDEGALDAETGGILGGCYRRKYEKTRQRPFLELALNAYRKAFEATGDPYPGINTASILLELKNKDEARTIANQVFAAATRIAEGTKTDHWTYATIGEAAVIGGNTAAARTAYQRAAQDAVQLFQDVAVMRRGARRALEGIGALRSELDDVFSVPRPMAFVGHGFDLPGQRIRFPREGGARNVRLAIRDLLDRLGGLLGIASATVGGDTIFLDEILKRDGFARVLLPCAEGRFLDDFVPQPERKYELRQLFRHPRAELVVVNEPSDPADLWGDFGPRLRDKAEEWADTLDETPLLIALWDQQPSFLESVINLWNDEGWDVEPLPMRDGRVVSTPGAAAGV